MPIEDMSYILSIQPIPAQRFHEIAEALPEDSTARESKSLCTPACFIEQSEVGAPLQPEPEPGMRRWCGWRLPPEDRETMPTSAAHS